MTVFRFQIYLLACLLPCLVSAQHINVSGQINGPVAKAMKEVQFVLDGQMERMLVDKNNFSFSGKLKMNRPQFVEIKSGNSKPMFFYLLPDQTMRLSIEKNSLAESIVRIENERIEKINKIFDSYFEGLREAGIDMRIRDWQTLLFTNNKPLDHAERRLKEQMAKNSPLVSSIPNFRSDVELFMKSFRIYTEIDRLSLDEILKHLGDLKKIKFKSSDINIPFFRDYLTDLTNAYAARSLEKYGLSLDYLKQRHIAQFMAAEAIQQYVSDTTLKNYLYGEKLKIELPTNGIKNETYVNFLMSYAGQSVHATYQDRIETLKANRMPDLNAPRKKAFDFLLHDSTGKAYRLADFKGKLVFVDFWASWCAPCKAQIPYQKELEKAYAGKDIVFLSVSLDRSKEAWLKAVAEEELHGYILHAENDFRNAFPRAYGVESIPRYMLIDAQGNIISDNMIKPQNKKEISGIFNEELYADRTREILERHYKAIGAENIKQNGIFLQYRQSVMTFHAQNKTYYRFPQTLKSTNQFEADEQMRVMMGPDFFLPKYMIMQGDSIQTNMAGQTDYQRSWVNRLPGMELFLRTNVQNATVRFSDDNDANNDTSFVLKIVFGGNTERYHINKKTYLLDRITSNAPVDPRKGSGFIESFVAYEQYQSVNGVMIPFRSNMGNITSLKVEKAEVRPVSDAEFQR